MAGLVVVAIGVTAFVVSGGTGGTDSGLGARLSNWVTSSDLGQDVGVLVADGTAVTRAERTKMSALHTVCAAMADDAQNANGQLPAPDSEVTQLLAKAYGLEYDAAEACIRASGRRSSLLVQSAKDRASAKTLFDEALGRVHAVSGRTVSTTTTTAPTSSGTGFA